MSNGAAPWSVKGIDPRAREAAREAARQRGLTIGEWLNQAILANEAALASARQTLPAAPAEARADSALAEALTQLADRVDANDRRAALAIGTMDRSLSAIGARLEAASRAAQSVSGGEGQVDGLLQELREAQSALLLRMRKIEEEEIVALKGERRLGAERFGALEENVSQLAARVSGAEADTGAALRSLETSLASLDEKLTRADGKADTSELEARFSLIADSLTAQVQDTRVEFAGQLANALGDLKPDEMRAALGDLSKRIAATERRHAQTIEAVSIEIKRLNESMERRLRSIEARNDDGAAAQEQIREQVKGIANTVDQRFAQMEQREAQTFAHISHEIGHIADRLEQRVGLSESNSAQAIAQVGEQVAIMAERLHDRQDRLAEELVTRLNDSEERQHTHMNDVLGNLSAYLDQIEHKAASGVDPLQGAMAHFSERLEAIETRIGGQGALLTPAPAPQPAQSEAPPASQRNPDLYEEEREIPLPAPVETEAVIEDKARVVVDEEALASHHAALREMVTHLHQRATEMQDDVVPDTIFVEDIEARFRERDQATFDPTESEALTEPTHDPFDDLNHNADDEEDLWSTGRADDTPALPRTHDEGDLEADTPLGDSAEEPFYEADALYSAEVDKLMFDAPQDQTASTRDDYISTARRAALASAITTPASAKQAEKERLRGGTRVVLWTAATAAVAAAAGGAYYYTQYVAPVTEAGARPAPSLPRAAAPVAAPPGSIAEATAPDAAEPLATEPLAPPAAEETHPAGGGGEDGPVRAGPISPLTWNAPDARTVEDAVAKGDAVAQYDLAMMRLGEGKPNDAAALLKRAASKGLAMAQYRLAKLYENGQGVAADLSAARRLTEQAARAGNANAMHDFGVYLANAEGAAMDEKGAFGWFRQAAERGVADSQFNVALLYQQGRGVTPDEGLAYVWFTIAAANGDQDAAARAAMIERGFSRDQLTALRQNAAAFQAIPTQAFANGDFGARPWAPAATMQAAAAIAPQS